MYFLITAGPEALATCTQSTGLTTRAYTAAAAVRTVRAELINQFKRISPGVFSVEVAYVLRSLMSLFELSGTHGIRYVRHCP